LATQLKKLLLPFLIRTYALICRTRGLSPLFAWRSLDLRHICVSPVDAGNWSFQNIGLTQPDPPSPLKKELPEFPPFQGYGVNRNQQVLEVDSVGNDFFTVGNDFFFVRNDSAAVGNDSATVKNDSARVVGDFFSFSESA
jgi:hypothetical protein